MIGTLWYRRAMDRVDAFRDDALGDLDAVGVVEAIRAGSVSAIELVDANEQRFLAEVNFAEAEFSLANAYLALLEAMGRGPLDLEVP